MCLLFFVYLLEFLDVCLVYFCYEDPEHNCHHKNNHCKQKAHPLQTFHCGHKPGGNQTELFYVRDKPHNLQYLEQPNDREMHPQAKWRRVPSGNYKYIHENIYQNRTKQIQKKTTLHMFCSKNEPNI